MHPSPPSLTIIPQQTLTSDMYSLSHFVFHSLYIVFLHRRLFPFNSHSVSLSHPFVSFEDNCTLSTPTHRHIVRPTHYIILMYFAIVVSCASRCSFVHGIIVLHTCLSPFIHHHSHIVIVIRTLPRFPISSDSFFLM